MRLKFGNKSLEYAQGEYPKTRVLLINDEGAMYPIYFDKEAIDKSDAELFDLALEKIYQDNFPNRAEDEKFNLLGEKIAKYDELIENSQNAIKDLEETTAEAKAAAIKNEEAVNNAVSELTELIMGILGQSTANILVDGTE